MFRKFIRLSVAVLIPTLAAVIFTGCSPTRGGGSATTDSGGSQLMGGMDGQASLSTSSHTASLPDPQEAEGHYAD